MANILIKQGKEIAGSSLVTPSSKADKTDLTNIIQTGTTSSQAISAGTYFYLNDVLVRAKADIANGATFTLNTNYEVVTAGALNELNDSGWITVNTYLSYRKIGNLVYIRLSAGYTVDTNSWTVVGTLPSNITPSKETFACFYYSNASFTTARLYTNGNVGVNGNTSLNGQVSFALG